MLWQSGLYDTFSRGVLSFSTWIHAPKDYEKVLFGGILGSWFSLLQFFMTPFVGAASDVFGRKCMLLSCLTGVSLSYFVWTQSRGSFLMFCISRTLGGLSKGNVSLSTAIVSDVSDQKDRGKGMAMIGIAFSIGFMVGPMMGAFLSSSQDSSLKGNTFFLLPAVVAVSLSLFNLFFTSFFFEESLSCKNRVSQQDLIMFPLLCWNISHTSSATSLASNPPTFCLLHFLDVMHWLFFCFLQCSSVFFSVLNQLKTCRGNTRKRIQFSLKTFFNSDSAWQTSFYSVCIIYNFSLFVSILVKNKSMRNTG